VSRHDPGEVCDAVVSLLKVEPRPGAEARFSRRQGESGSRTAQQIIGLEDNWSAPHM